MNTIKIINIHVMVFFVIVSLFTINFDYPLPIIPLSIYTIFSLYVLLLFPLGLISIYVDKQSFLFQHTSSFLLTSLAFGLLIVYCLNLIGNQNWGTNVTFTFIGNYINELNKIENTLPVPLNVVYIASSILALLIYCYYYKNIENILQNLEVITKKSFNFHLPPKKLIYTWLTILSPLFLIFSYNLTHAPLQNDMWDGEPITDLIKPYTTIELNHVKSTKNETTFSYQENDIDDKPNIILIIADAMRSDHISSYGYHRKTTKFIDSLFTSGKAIKIENAFSTCAESNCGILSTLSSRPLREISKNNIKLNNVLKTLGYDINFILSADHTWAGLKEHYPPYDLFYDGNSTNKYAKTDDQLILDKLKSIKEFSKPSFFYFHLMSSHPSGIRKKQFNRYFPAKSPHDWFYRLPIVKNIFKTDTHLLEVNNYDNGVISADFYIKQIYKTLEKKGYLQNSIVWIIADHGEALSEHGHYGHIRSLYNEEIKIPMIIVDKQKDQYKERFYATQIDIAPTILDRIGITPPQSWKGNSLLKEKKETFISHHHIPDRKGNKALIIKDQNKNLYKFMYNEIDLDISEIYDLNKDPKEQINLYKNEFLIDVLKTNLEHEKQTNKEKLAQQSVKVN